MTTAIDVDDDILLDNAAAASLLSPSLWINRSNSRSQRKRPLHSDNKLVQSVCNAFNDEGTAKPEGGAELSEHDPEGEAEFLEQLREDLARLSALEAMYSKLKLQNSMLEQQLMGIYSAVNGVLEENRCMRRLMSLLQVQRGDFVDEGREQQEAGEATAAAVPGPVPGAGTPAQHAQQQVAQQDPPAMDHEFLARVGRRLMANLTAAEGAGGGAAAGVGGGGQGATGAGQHAEAMLGPFRGAGEGSDTEDERDASDHELGAAFFGDGEEEEHRLGMGMAGPHQGHDQLHAQGGAVDQLAGQGVNPPTPNAKPPPAAQTAETPKIGALRNGGGGKLAAHPSHRPLNFSGVDPDSEEAQIAAAVLAKSGGDAAAAITTLLNHAMLVRQDHTE